MLKLESYKVCPFWKFCEHQYDDVFTKCRGADPKRSNLFVCELWAENYIKGSLTH